MSDPAALAPRTPPRLSAETISLGYDGAPILSALTTRIPDGSFTVIIGPNACGKSTLLRGLSRLLRPSAGAVVLDGTDISRLPVKEVARRLGLLPQTASAPEGITVADLVGRGRYPHLGLWRQWTEADEDAIRAAMTETGVDALSGRRVEELSGGQRQRVWVAMVLAQQTDLLLLDEPTTFLDIAHQIELMELFSALNRAGRTIVAVLHDLNHAARYADHVIAMKQGRIVAEGAPADVITTERVEEIFDLPNVVIPDPVTGGPLVVPLGGRHTGAEAQ
ncbi:ABC transporter ATP-binding protein [Microbacterium hominis]|uniref:ABC transporter ATP-binding protein n=1 Tax=Microbacterium TaxID=33882 RepID=UPI00168B9FD9|nr:MULTISPECIES: ABC transporter ATP-binding protein [Microbacterium]QOC25180.1 ABC transporter ATP-binding protein [Microbacterium hominis]QOC29214.1 ABC transporter ATP-binding protein [Microbacterium hominis]QYF98591.1 ABC transporter ATP-binding protein [Microbacterium sp. PAMC21962]